MTVSVLEVPFDNAGNKDALYPAVLHNKTEVVLVDCGYPGFMPLIDTALHQHNFSLQQLTGIIITHADIDHLGALYAIKKACPHIKVYSSVVEEKYINGKEKSPRLVQAEDMQASLPEDRRAGALQFIAMLKSVQPVTVDATLEEGEELSFLPGIQVVYTPGHMPGHISLYEKKSKTLIAADAIVIENGYLEIANPQFTLDLPRAIASIKKIARLDIEKLICYHGGVVHKNIQELLQQLIAKYENG